MEDLKVIIKEYQISDKVSDSELLKKRDKIGTLNKSFAENESAVWDLCEKSNSKEQNNVMIGKLRRLKRFKLDYEGIAEREIVSRDLWKENIDIAEDIVIDTFTGNMRNQDFFAFKTKFEKKHRKARKDNLPDMLKLHLMGKL